MWVESNTLQCVVPECAKMYQRHRRPGLAIGGPCPACERRLRDGIRSLDPVIVESFLNGTETADEFVQRRPNLRMRQVGTLDVRFHVVDLAMFAPVGQCSCEHFQFSLQPRLVRMSPEERTAVAEAHRCSHIKAARDFALDLVVYHHEARFGAAVSTVAGKLSSISRPLVGQGAVQSTKTTERK
jgi:hypothetical protein